MMVGCMGAMVKVIQCQEEKINGCVSLTTVQRESKPGDWDYHDVNDDHDDYHDDDCDDDDVYQLELNIAGMVIVMMMSLIKIVTYNLWAIFFNYYDEDWWWQWWWGSSRSSKIWMRIWCEWEWWWFIYHRSCPSQKWLFLLINTWMDGQVDFPPSWAPQARSEAWKVEP